MTKLRSLDPASYQRHSLHAEGCAWVEKNCYIDIWIEVLHAYGLDPMAVLPFTLTVDFEGDQWTFFKPPHRDLWDLYGVDVQEMTVWKPLIEHAQLHLAAGRLVSTEADAFYLPDTQGTDYRSQHTKTTIVIHEIDAERRRLGYFHNAAYYGLEGDDFDHLFRTKVGPDPTFMPLFAELIRVDRARALAPATLRAESARLLARHAGRRPEHNPVAKFAEQFPSDLATLQQQGLPRYHAYAFAVVRQLGAAFELASLYLSWLSAEDADLASAARSFTQISAAAKALILKGARAVNSKKPADFSALLGDAAREWDAGMRSVDSYIARVNPS